MTQGLSLSEALQVTRRRAERSTLFGGDPEYRLVVPSHPQSKGGWKRDRERIGWAFHRAKGEVLIDQPDFLFGRLEGETALSFEKALIPPLNSARVFYLSTRDSNLILTALEAEPVALGRHRENLETENSKLRARIRTVQVALEELASLRSVDGQKLLLSEGYLIPRAGRPNRCRVETRPLRSLLDRICKAVDFPGPAVSLNRAERKRNGDT